MKKVTVSLFAVVFVFSLVSGLSSDDSVTIADPANPDPFAITAESN